MPTNVIQLKDIHKYYSVGNIDVHALQSINFTVSYGEFLSIVGPSGSGKSTLMNIIGCLDTPDKGNYFLNGYDVTTKNDDELAKIRNNTLGFVFQNFNLLPRTTALENVETPLIYCGVKKRERQKKALGLLERVGLGDRVHHTTGQLSGGEQQRVAIARALVNQPIVLLADEPTGNLDSVTSAAIMSLLHEINQEDGVTVLIITHDPEVASKTSRVLTLRDGKLVIDE